MLLAGLRRDTGAAGNHTERYGSQPIDVLGFLIDVFRQIQWLTFRGHHFTYNLEASQSSPPGSWRLHS